MPKVINKCKTHNYSKDSVYIGRPSKWGNPFLIGRDGDREEVINKYKDYLFHNELLLDSLHELRGKDLVCFCAPLACHGDVLMKLANASEVKITIDDTVYSILRMPKELMVIDQTNPKIETKIYTYEHAMYSFWKTRFYEGLFRL